MNVSTSGNADAVHDGFGHIELDDVTAFALIPKHQLHIRIYSNIIITLRKQGATIRSISLQLYEKCMGYRIQYPSTHRTETKFIFIFQREVPPFTYRSLIYTFDHQQNYLWSDDQAVICLNRRSHVILHACQVWSYTRDTLAAHYSDVKMGAKITSLMIVYPTICSCADQMKHHSSASLAFVRGFHRDRWIPSHKWPVTRKMFPLDDVIME